MRWRVGDQSPILVILCISHRCILCESLTGSVNRTPGLLGVNYRQLHLPCPLSHCGHNVAGSVQSNYSCHFLWEGEDAQNNPNRQASKDDSQRNIRDTAPVVRGERCFSPFRVDPGGRGRTPTTDYRKNIAPLSSHDGCFAVTFFNLEDAPL